MPLKAGSPLSKSYIADAATPETMVPIKAMAFLVFLLSITFPLSLSKFRRQPFDDRRQPVYLLIPFLQHFQVLLLQCGQF